MSNTASGLEKYQFDNVVVWKRRAPSAVFAEERYERAFDYPKHEHQEAYFMLTDHCVYREKLGSKTFHHPPNTILWRPAGISHSDGMVQTNGRSFSVYVKDGLLSQFSDYAKIPVEFSEKGSYLVFLVNRLRNEFRNWSQGSELIAEGLVLEMLGHSARMRVPTGKSPPDWMARIVEKLEYEYLEKHTNVGLAGEVGIHPVHLARTFRKYYGKSIGRFLRERRVHHAMQLMAQGDMSLAEIASASGFSDQSQLTRAFKDVVGITPGAFKHEVTPSR